MQQDIIFQFVWVWHSCLKSCICQFTIDSTSVDRSMIAEFKYLEDLSALKFLLWWV